VVPVFPDGNQVWRRHFGGAVPATTFVPTLVPGFAIAEARCEINLIAFKGSKMAVNAEAPPACDGHPHAVRAGDLLLTSGLLERPVESLQAMCTLEQALRIQIFYTDEAEFHATCRALQRCVPGTPLPISGVRVPGPLLIPACKVQIEAWIYATP
jgi:hypothetical protein